MPGNQENQGDHVSYAAIIFLVLCSSDNDNQFLSIDVFMAGPLARQKSKVDSRIYFVFRMAWLNCLVPRAHQAGYESGYYSIASGNRRMLP